MQEERRFICHIFDYGHPTFSLLLPLLSFFSLSLCSLSIYLSLSLSLSLSLYLWAVTSEHWISRERETRWVGLGQVNQARGSSAAARQAKGPLRQFPSL